MTASTMLEERDVGFGTGSAAMEMEQGYQASRRCLRWWEEEQNV